jgi:hypothetical protein
LTTRLAAIMTGLARHGPQRAHNVDPKPYMAEWWSTGHPLTVFCKGFGAGGWATQSQAIRALLSRFASGAPGDFEVLAAEVVSDLAYIVGFERSMAIA